MSHIDPLDGCGPAIVAMQARAGRTIYLRAFDGAARAAFMRMAKEDRAETHEIAALGICKSESDPTLAYTTPEQKELLASKDGALLHEIATQLCAISGLGPSATADAEKKS